MNQIALMILNAARAAYNADRAKVYINPTNFDYDIGIRTPPFNGRFYAFTPGVNVTHVRLKAFGTKDEHGVVICDGATMASDAPKGVKKSAGLHDPGYLELDAIAEQWASYKFDPGPNLKRNWFMRKSENWTREDVRLLLDAMFGDSIRKLGGSSIIYGSYYNVVRYSGGIFHALSSRGITLPNKIPLLMIISTTITVCGCSGCLEVPHLIQGAYKGPDLQDVTGQTSTTNTVTK